ncbi:MAG: ABC transporter permease [Bacteroidetes bacterium]|nr:ABC transporter permease [Bacteroidota bacterium]
MKKSSSSPSFALRILASLCPPSLYESIEGDLLEQYEEDEKEFGEKKASRRLFWNTLKFIRPGIVLRNKFSFNLFDHFMLLNYFKVASRVMARNKAFTLINVFGLTLGITGAILLFLWIGQEFTYDQFHADKDRIYKAWNRATDKGNINCWDVTPRVLAPTLQEQLSSIESAASYAGWGDQLLFTVGENRFLKSTGAYTDSTFLRIFNFSLLKGDARTALREPASIVLTEHFAKELFGDKDPFGETLNIGASGNTFPLKITGILKDLPSNTDFKFEYLIPFHFVDELQGGMERNWGNNSVASYIKLKAGSDFESVNQQIKDIAKKNREKSKNIDVFLYPLTKMRLYSKFENGIPSGGRIEIIRMLAILGICLIVIACINFINLSTARAQRRAKEVAVRKVSGAFRFSLVAQFLCESILTAAAAGIVSVGIAYLVLPLFSSLVQQPLKLDIANPFVWGIGLTFTILIGVLAGVYPALYISSFKPVKILKGMKLSASSRSITRNFLVVVQFGFAVMLVISAIVIQRQINFVQNRDTGYSKDHLIYQYLTGDLPKNYTAYKNELIQSGIAESVTKTSSPITERWSNTSSIGWNGKDPQVNILFERFYMDEHISSTAKLNIIEGRDMDLSQFPSDSTAVIINETSAKAMGFKQPLGEIITDNGQDWHVVGVVKDFVLTSPFQKVEPLLLFGCKGDWAFNVIHIRFNTSHNTQQSIAKLSELAKKYNPEYPFEYHFVDVEYENKFANLKTTQLITNIFSAIAILIAGLGLLGLSTYMIEVREKEIGIRKVMGGSVANITRLLTVNSLKPIFIAIVLFSPLGWMAMKWWLNSYAYRVDLNFFTIAYAGLAIISISVAIISVQVIRAAKANPVDTLRNE